MLELVFLLNIVQDVLCRVKDAVAKKKQFPNGQGEKWRGEDESEAGVAETIVACMQETHWRSRLSAAPRNGLGRQLDL